MKRRVGEATGERDKYIRFCIFFFHLPTKRSIAVQQVEIDEQNRELRNG